MDSNSEVFDLLLRVLRDLRRSCDTGAAQVGLTISRARVITRLSTMEGATQAELAQALDIEAPTLKRHIDWLEGQGYMERRSVDGDARKRALFLTEKAQSNIVRRFMQAARVQMLEGIPDEDRIVLQRALAKMADNAAKVGDSWRQ
ncbi:MarR family transcriptional regulator (plasmid) [Ketogulonicigenium robustum]|uniref:MarR family transcriptional regulator n=1 Tax=Ketogulonicigenium robustum TaxID=92947 RepID=A0A1W6P2V3_9RHOB|nr:MarR family transcriptional regulator [Ketogulonicigenium robustum]ARO15842.1 MarR family transcriptional regulator [Ketogulonicigenium robustum]